jgi:hypothetical protein
VVEKYAGMRGLTHGQNTGRGRSPSPCCGDAARRPAPSLGGVEEWRSVRGFTYDISVSEGNDHYTGFDAVSQVADDGAVKQVRDARVAVTP